MARSLVSPTTTTSAAGSHRLEGTPEMTSDVQVLVRRGPAVAVWFDAVEGLRASVFRCFPYLYEGDTEYEKHYLAMYARSADRERKRDEEGKRAAVRGGHGGRRKVK